MRARFSIETARESDNTKRHVSCSGAALVAPALRRENLRRRLLRHTDLFRFSAADVPEIADRL